MEAWDHGIRFQPEPPVGLLRIGDVVTTKVAVTAKKFTHIWHSDG